MMTYMQWRALWDRAGELALYFSPLANLVVRIEIFGVFFRAGWLKLTQWQSTLYLFHHEYAVPFLSPKLAAVMGTGVELIVPWFILLGLGGRLPMMIMFFFNVVAVISFATIWQHPGGGGFQDHFYWGLMLLFIWLHGAGSLSADYWLKKIRTTP